MLTKRKFLYTAALATITVAASRSSTPVLAQADRPGFFAAKDIAEAGFIYGLPIVMGAVRNAVGIRYGVFPGNMRLSFQAARSIG